MHGFLLSMLLFALLYVETIIPVCPPACGQARYGGAATLSTSTAALYLAIFVYLFRLVFFFVARNYFSFALQNFVSYLCFSFIETSIPNINYAGLVGINAATNPSIFNTLILMIPSILNVLFLMYLYLVIF